VDGVDCRTGYRVSGRSDLGVVPSIASRDHPGAKPTFLVHISFHRIARAAYCGRTCWTFLSSKANLRAGKRTEISDADQSCSQRRCRFLALPRFHLGTAFFATHFLAKLKLA